MTKRYTFTHHTANPGPGLPWLAGKDSSTGWRRSLSWLLGVVLLLGGSGSARAQVQLLNATFEAGNDGFTLVNGAATNKWVRSTGAAGALASANAVYISNAGTTYAYTISGARSLAHAYVDVAIPANQVSLSLSFYWKGQGEAAADYLRVSYAPTTFVPTALSGGGAPIPVGTPIPGTGTGSPTILLDNLRGQAAYVNGAATLPLSLAGTTVRLIFSWTNTNGGGLSRQPLSTMWS